MTLSPPRWTLDELRAGAEVGLRNFREQRGAEIREDYSNHFDEAQGQVEEVLELTRDLLDLQGNAREVVNSAKYREVLRYLAAPPISADDLESLSGIKKSQWTSVQSSAGLLVEVVRGLIDAGRYPWLFPARDPEEAEKHAAIVATAAQIASSHVQTSRRIESKKAQEALVKTSLAAARFTEVESRTIDVLRSAPNSGGFCGESKLGGDKADVVVGLFDDRVMPIECKVSNSAVNSYKRINLEAANKAKNWIARFGDRQMAPAAVISGVFRPENLFKAQQEGLTLWWAHDIDRMIEWVNGTRD